MELFQLYLTFFFSLLLQSLPSLLLGIFLSSALLIWGNPHQIAAKFPSNRLLGALMGSGLGLIFPVGQYGIIPLTRRLLLQGVPIAAAWSFLVAGPTVNIITLWLSWQVWANQPRIIFLRLLLGWLMGFLIGVLWSYSIELPISTDQDTLRATPLITGTILHSPEAGQPILHRVGNLIYEYPTLELSPQKRLPVFWENTVYEVRELGSILILGCAVAGMISLFLPQSEILLASPSPFMQTIGMMLLSSVFSLDSWMSSSVGASFNTFILEGSSLAFLLVGSVNIISLGLLFNIFRPKLVIYLLIIITQLTLLFSLIINSYI